MTTDKLLEQLNKWMEQCEQHAEVFRTAGLTSSEITSMAMAQAYWNVKQLIEVNTESK